MDPGKAIFGHFIDFGHFPIEIPIEAEKFYGQQKEGSYLKNNHLEKLPLTVIKQFRAHPLPYRPTHTCVVLKATFNCSVDSTTLDVGDLSEMEKDVDEQDMVEGGCG